MGNRRGNKPGGPSSATQSVIKQYGAAASTKRLQEQGLHKKVTKASAKQEIEQWNSNKNDSVKYRNGNLPSFGEYIDVNELVKRLKVTRLEEHQTQNPILGMFAGWQPYGQIMGEHLAFAGIPNLVKLAEAYSEGWEGLSRGMAVWDTVLSDFRGTPSGYVFVALTPKLTHGEFLRNPEYSKDWEHAARNNVVEIISTIHRECGPSTPFWVTSQETAVQEPEVQEDDLDDDDLEAQQAYLKVLFRKAAVLWHGMLYGEKLVQRARSIPHVEDLAERVAALVDPAAWQAYHMSRQVAFATTFRTLGNIYNRSRTLRVLHFHATPLLDRRLVAIVARACPNLKMLGIYDCPGLHFGDTICLLDLIHEINSSRPRGQARIEALDYYPRYNTGSPLEKAEPGEDANAYGLSWRKLRSDAHQRGLFGILLQVVLKAKRMNIQLLMDRDRALMTYLSKLPLVPLQVFGFLDGLYRYLDLMAARSADKNAVQQAMYDILKPVRIGLEPMENDWPNFYCHEMGQTMMFCSSCGYEYLEDFFTQSGRSARPHSRVCAACTLRLWLDEEPDNGKRDGKEIWEPFFPKWKRAEFNADAPLHQHGKDLIQLKSTEEVRPFPPPPQIDAQGNVFRPPFTEPLVRDGKIHNDSLQNLPTLREMIDRETFCLSMDRARVIDARKTVHALLKDFYAHAEDGIPAYKDAVPDFESQGRARRQQDFGLESHSFESAAIFFNNLQHKTFGELKAHRNANERNPTGFW
ncbi:hypothetical protein N0V84_010487 [Fusarium piperis]|uniref:Uncharacterized protein n=1 Tax=Fusarium piperis TaxID=1435070 RepID=A0A9W8TDW2_9HYPO|nr:hypothetical protein N0V84_010487 [Fusarium piperis]